MRNKTTPPSIAHDQVSEQTHTDDLCIGYLPADGRQAQPLAVWQTEPCPLWCDCDEEEHAEQHFPGDRRHHLYRDHDLAVPLLMHNMVDYGVTRNSDWQLARLRIHVEQLATEKLPFVRLYSDDVDPRCSLELRLEEALRLAAKLMLAVERVAPAMVS